MSFTTKEPFASTLLAKYENLPRGHYIGLVLLRTTQSEAIFRTEGSGEPLSREVTIAGAKTSQPIDRIVISKRKQTAVERRTGRELLRDNGGFDPKKQCLLNSQAPCAKCPDCFLYGYAVAKPIEGEKVGAQRSRVLTEDAFSLLDASEITSERMFNGLFDNSTMRNPETGGPSTALGSNEYVRPGTHFLDIETLKDVTAAEFFYVLGNILQSSRYGAIGTRIGVVKNQVLGIAVGKQEIFSTLELTQATYDLLESKQHPLVTEIVAETTVRAATNLIGKVFGWRGHWISGNDVTPMLAEVAESYQNPAKLVADLQACYPKS